MMVNTCKIRDVIVPAFSGTLLLSQWIVTKAIPGKTGTNHIPDANPGQQVVCHQTVVQERLYLNFKLKNHLYYLIYLGVFLELLELSST